MDSEKFMCNLLSFFPYWEYKVVRPFVQFSKQEEGQLAVDNFYLLQIVRWFKGLTMTELAHYLSISKQQATLKVDRLYKRGYLRRVPNPEDRRVIKVEATERAVRETDAYLAHVKGFVNVLSGRLKEEDLKAFNTAMETLLSVLPKLN